ncbi:hypothetical protein BABINDRAFT_142259 [Babjeviella inositovora NRRL Y-12698]|uniref:Sec39 domain-containing protein n=1 Tax=Babjeviella inositovora NRRL Y-12698 TaxID=984486 RepID=A0A1E3QNW6_9ASCO|nr:uncharacterized protein BABINDRAFT_142259 [Babjeviella inositovora NRRL Y-12698]ODQ79406.1 hypothetical protein BABINDRAFT_142259 [Babjeviella inositovora NRRL Y-12698]
MNTMSDTEQKLCLAVSWLASQLLTDDIATAIASSQLSDDTLAVILATLLVMIPEFSDADAVTGLVNTILSPSNTDYVDTEEALGMLITRHPELSTVCGSHTYSRFNALRTYVTAEAELLKLSSSPSSAGFAKAYIRKNNLLVHDLRFSTFAVPQLEFDTWQQGIVAPLTWLQQLSSNISLVEFESLSESDAFDYLVSFVTEANVDAVCENVLNPYLRYTTYQILINWLFQQERSTSSLETKYHILKSLVVFFATRLLLEDLEKLVNVFLSLCYCCPSVSLPIFLSIKETLAVLSDLNLPQGKPGFETSQTLENATVFDFSQLGICQPTKVSIKHLSTVIETAEQLYLNNLSFMDILHLSSATAEQQMLQLETLFSRTVPQITSAKDWTAFVSSTYRLYSHSQIFSQIKREDFNWYVFQTLVTHQQYTVLEASRSSIAQLGELDSQRVSKELASRFWLEVEQATNLNSSLSHLSSAKLILRLMGDEYPHCKSAMTVFDTLKNFKFHLEKNVPVTPYALLKQIRANYFVVLERILELNSKSYYAPEKLKRLSYEMDAISVNHRTTVEQDLRLMTLCAESALADDNFKYAYNFATKLLKEHSKEELHPFWLTFYQVGRYTSPSWSEEVREIWQQQLEVLSQTLLLLPDNQLEIKKLVLDQWYTLNARLRETGQNLSLNEERAEKGLEKRFTAALASGVKELGIDRKHALQAANDTTEKVSNLLVSGLGWAIGATPPA